MAIEGMTPRGPDGAEGVFGRLGRGLRAAGRRGRAPRSAPDPNEHDGDAPAPSTLDEALRRVEAVLAGPSASHAWRGLDKHRALVAALDARRAGPPVEPVRAVAEPTPPALSETVPAPSAPAQTATKPTVLGPGASGLVAPRIVRGAGRPRRLGLGLAPRLGRAEGVERSLQALHRPAAVAGMAAAGVTPAHRVADDLRRAFVGDLLGEPMLVEPLIDARLDLRLTLSLWPVGADPSEAARLRAAAEARLRADPWTFLATRQGVWRASSAGATLAYTVHLAPADLAERADFLGDAALARVERAFDLVAARRGFAPRLLELDGGAEGWRAVFAAEIPIAALRVTIGRRSPRVIEEVVAAGAPPTPIAPPPLLDLAFARALEDPTMSAADRADRLARSAVGRRALAAAAAREPRLRFVEEETGAGPWLTRRGAERLFDLAERCHGAVGWRARRWVWGATIAAAPALGLGLVLGGTQTLSAQAFGWAGDVAVYALGLAAPSAQAATLSAERVTAAALTGLLPFALLWVAALGLAATLNRRETRRVLGFSRGLRLGDVLGRGFGPWAALTLGGALYAFAFFGAAAAIGERPVATEIGSETRVSAPRRASAARPVAEATTRLGAPVRDGAWRVDAPGLASVGLTASGAVLEALCAGGGPTLRLASADTAVTDGLWIGAAVDGGTAALAAPASRAGALEWPAEADLVKRMRRGAMLEITILDAAGQPESLLRFPLAGSAEALDEAFAACQG